LYQRLYEEAQTRVNKQIEAHLSARREINPKVTETVFETFLNRQREYEQRRNDHITDSIAANSNLQACTFEPQINPTSQLLAELNQHFLQDSGGTQEPALKRVEQAPSFTPAINPISKLLAWDRDCIKELTKARPVLKPSQLDYVHNKLQEYTFHPSTNEGAPARCGVVPS
jgi:hypothetical protein